ncbi:hypothetical protein [Mumia sp. DW29H23]|uniref:hypothetical protein n=1 Tax=Mumia sp. DW29H23 TaxID=3421241 RepID=UPI003D681804
MATMTMSELREEHVELLPARETLFHWGNNWAGVYASNSSMALNAATAFSVAQSQANQAIQINQG